MQLPPRAQVDPHAERVFHGEFHPDDAQQRRAGRNVDQKVRIAVRTVRSSEGGAEHAHVAGAARTGNREDAFALGG